MNKFLFNFVLFVGYVSLSGCPASPTPNAEPQSQTSATGGVASSKPAGSAGRAVQGGGQAGGSPGGSNATAGRPHTGSAGAADDGADAGMPGPHAAAGHAATGGKGGQSGQSGAAGSGSAVCDPQCAAGQHCELVQVQCVRAPCPPIAMCVKDTAGTARCGSRGSAACPSEQYCEFPAGSQCGATDAGGSCKPKPQACTQQYDPVCGCDGQTYGNACSAASAGVSAAASGECGSAMTPPAGQVTCDPRLVLCKRGTPKCAEGSVPSVVGSCYGDCVPVEQCACDSADACPLRDSYTCLMSAKHCTPYL